MPFDNFLTPGNKRRFNQLYEAALNLGMSENDAVVYSEKALDAELEIGDWQITPRSTEAEHNNP